MDSLHQITFGVISQRTKFFVNYLENNNEEKKLLIDDMDSNKIEITDEVLTNPRKFNQKIDMLRKAKLKRKSKGKKPQTASQTVPQTAPQTAPQTTPQTIPQTTPQTAPQTVSQTKSKFKSNERKLNLTFERKKKEIITKVFTGHIPENASFREVSHNRFKVNNNKPENRAFIQGIIAEWDSKIMVLPISTYLEANNVS
jgi:hypothetical protein